MGGGTLSLSNIYIQSQLLCQLHRVIVDKSTVSVVNLKYEDEGIR